MKLGQLRNVLKVYEKNKGWWTGLVGDAKEVKQLKAYLLKHINKSDDYNLTLPELLEVVKIALTQDYSKFNQDLKDTINHSHSINRRRFIVEISHILQENGLLTEENFAHYAFSNFQTSHYIWSALHEFQESAELPLTSKNFEFIVFLLSIHFHTKDIINFLKTLAKRNLINDSVLDFLKMKGQQIYGSILIESILALDAVGLFTEEKSAKSRLALLADEKYMHVYFEVLAHLGRYQLEIAAEEDKSIKIREVEEGEKIELTSTGLPTKKTVPVFDDEIFQATLSADMQVIYQLDKILPYLTQGNYLEKEDILTLLRIEWSYLMQLASVFTLLDNNNVLSRNAVKWLISEKKNIFLIESILGILAKENLLGRPVINFPFPESDYHFLKIVEYLSEAKVLNENTLNTLLPLVIIKQIQFARLLDTFSQHHFYINEENLNIIFSKARQRVDDNHYSEVSDIFLIFCKEAKALANNENLTILLNLSSRNLQALKSMIETLATNKLLDQVSFSLALECANIKLTAPKPDESQSYEEVLEKEPLDKKAKHEAKYYHLLGRTAPCFFNQESQREIKLDQLSPEQVQAESFSNRLQWIISSLSDLSVLHDHHRIHGNISPMNFAVNLKEAKMFLVDFKSARKRYSQQSTLDYLHDIEMAFHFYAESFSDDMYAYSFVIAKTFPEIYKMDELGNYEIKADIMETPENYAVMTLVDSMRYSEKSERCSCSEALNYCQKLAEKQNFDANEVNAIADATIHNPEPTLDNTLHGVSRLSR